MSEWAPLAVSLPFIAALLLSGAWASRRFRRFEQLPGHFDLRGRVTRTAPRAVIVRMLPILFSALLLVIAIVTALIPDTYLNGDPVIGALAGGIALLAAQILVLWLTERWTCVQKD